jgi:exodeoxyribonuclease-1
MSFVFYDTETTGTATAFDQFLQFAAIKTDNNFSEIDSFNIRCRLQGHIVPSPGALVVTKVRPASLIDSKLPSHYEAVKQIRAKLLSWSPATFVGWNSIGFDENLLRQALFQTLHPAYLTNTHGNARGDIMRVAHATSVYAPATIIVPLGADKKPTFKLDVMAPANGFEHNGAHEAMADVRATIFMARLIRERAPAIWESMHRSSRKNDVLAYVQSLPMLSLTERSFGRTNSWLVAGCGVNAGNSGQLAVFDLAFNPDEFVGHSTEQLVALLKGKNRVIRTVRANAQPILMPADSAPVSTKALAISKNELARRAGVITASKDFQVRVAAALAAQYEDSEPAVHIEERIYESFPSDDDQGLMEIFHTAPWEERHGIAQKFKDERLVEFGRRLMFAERPDLVPQQDADALKGWVAKRIMSEDDVPWMTVPKALAETDELLIGATDEQKKLLAEVKEFLEGLADQHRA